MSEILGTDGKCLACREYSHADEEGKTCISDTCENNNFLKTDGTCEHCPEYSKVDETGKICVQSQCDPLRFIMTKEGDCLSLGEDEESIDETKVDPIYEGEGANAFKTDLKMQGTPATFIEVGGSKNFKEKLSGSLEINPSQV